MQMQSLITCPECGFVKEETMPLESCQFLYQCANCQKILRTKHGDCCVFCSYGTAPCPSKQQGYITNQAVHRKEKGDDQETFSDSRDALRELCHAH